MKQLFGLISLIILIVIGFVLGNLPQAFTFSRTYNRAVWERQQRIIPNVSVRGFAIGQMTRDEAQTTLHHHYADFLTTPVTFELEGYTFQPTPEQLGLTLEIDEAVEQAYELGHRRNPFLSLWETQSVWQHGTDIPLRLTVDQRALQTYLAAVAHEVDRSPVDATLAINGGQVVSSPAKRGRQLLVDATMQDIPFALQHLEPLSVTLQTRPLHPALDDTGIAEAQQYLRSLLHTPLTLTTGNRQWTWSLETIGTLVDIKRVDGREPGRARITATLNRQRVEDQLQAMATEFDIAPLEPRIRFVSSEATTTTERLRIVQPGQDGRRLEVEPSLDMVIEALGQGHTTVDLPVVVAQPGARPDTLDSLGIVELVAQGKSSFANSESYRIANIQAGARRMDGVLIPPDGEFSFNQTVGAVDASNGFTQGYAIVNGRTQLEWGGGICQISTTVFRAAFWAGVPITERNYHTYRLTWYEVFEPVGMDATIFTPYGPDLRFVNDTGHWLLMEAFADTTNQIMYINLYGTRTGRDVVQLTPGVTGNAFGGVDVNLGRIVRQNGDVLYQDNFFSRFKPWPNF